MATRRSTIRMLLLSAFYIFYLVIGAAIFSAIEGPVEREAMKKSQLARDKLMERFRRHNEHCKSPVSDESIDTLLSDVIEAYSRGVSVTRNVTNQQHWSFAQSVFFATSVLTTIGYGHVSPLSEPGKVFCVIYAALGIPLTLIVLTAVVERLMLVTTWTLTSLTRRLGHLYRAVHIRLLHISVLASIVFVLVVLVPAAVFTALESRWSYMEAFYFCFISMSTIGLGDYIPGEELDQPNRALYKIGATMYLLVGLALMMLTLANVYDIPELHIGRHFYLRSDQQDEEQRRLRPAVTGTAVPDKPRYTAEQVNRAYSGRASGDPTDVE